MMYYFIASVVALFLGFFLYSARVDWVFGPNPYAETPSIRNNDGVDFYPLPAWKLFVIQFINIAGLGPIFGAVLGAAYGPVAYIWIVLGAIFAGGVHDYFAGMISLKLGGANITDVTGRVVHPKLRCFMQWLILAILMFIGVIFAVGSAAVISEITSWDKWTLIVAIFVFYLAVTVLPIDKFISKIFPISSLALLIVAMGIMVKLLLDGNVHTPSFPIVDFSTANIMPLDIIEKLSLHYDKVDHPIIPVIFFCIGCGALSGYHSTKAHMVSRCLANEKHGRWIFYGSMIAESLLALIWATAAMDFFRPDAPTISWQAMNEYHNNPALAIHLICNNLLGPIGGAMAVLCVAIVPILSGGTSFRAARTIIADSLSIEQKSLSKRLVIGMPLLVLGLAMTPMDFHVVWHYFGLINQCLATFVLWTAAIYLAKEHKPHWIASIPAAFMTAAVSTGVLFFGPPLGLSLGLMTLIGVFVAVGLFIFFIRNNNFSMV